MGLKPLSKHSTSNFLCHRFFVFFWGGAGWNVYIYIPFELLNQVGSCASALEQLHVAAGR